MREHRQHGEGFGSPLPRNDGSPARKMIHPDWYVMGAKSDESYGVHSEMPSCKNAGCIPFVEDVLTFGQLRRANLKRLAHFPGHNNGEGDVPWDEADWAVAVTGELGELCNMLKKIRRGTSYPGMKMPTDEDIAGEVADIATYLDLLAAVLGIDLGQAIVRKFNEVSERWDLPDRL